MKQIRNGVFETNSSSTHSLTMCTEEEFDKWKKGELLFDSWNDCFVENRTISEQEKEGAKQHYNDLKGLYWKDWEQLSEQEIETWYNKYLQVSHRDCNYDGTQTYKEWSEDYNLSNFIQHYTSPSGDKIVCFGKFGYDG